MIFWYCGAASRPVFNIYSSFPRSRRTSSSLVFWKIHPALFCPSCVSRALKRPPECVKGVLDGLGVPEYGYRLLGIVHDDKTRLARSFQMRFRPFFVFRLGQTYILLVSCDICQPVDVPFTCVVGQFADTPPVFRTFAERENGIAVFVLGVVFGEVRRLRENWPPPFSTPRSRCGRWPKSRE